MRRRLPGPLAALIIVSGRDPVPCGLMADVAVGTGTGAYAVPDGAIDGLSERRGDVEDHDGGDDQGAHDQRHTAIS